jgi:hypothetical protein
MKIPDDITLYRIIHVDNLATLLARGALHAPNRTPEDGLPYRTIHNASVQASRHERLIPKGPGGTCHDYVPFYFGPLSVMLLNLKTGYVAGYREGQEPLIYLTTSLARMEEAQCRFVFSDGHGLAKFTNWYDNPAQLDQVDWNIVGARYWNDKPDDNDRQRRKQAEFLVYESMDWSLVERIGVRNAAIKVKVEDLLAQFPALHRPPVVVKHEWYY